MIENHMRQSELQNYTTFIYASIMVAAEWGVGNPLLFHNNALSQSQLFSTKTINCPSK